MHPTFACIIAKLETTTNKRFGGLINAQLQLYQQASIITGFSSSRLEIYSPFSICISSDTKHNGNVMVGAENMPMLHQNTLAQLNYSKQF